MTAFYRLLLRLYSREFRRRYARDMVRTFVDGRRAAGAIGLRARWTFFLCATRDAVVNAAAERAGQPGDGPRARMEWERLPHLASVLQDTRFAARMVWRHPALTFLSAATLALSIGAVTAVMSVVDAALIQPLPFPSPREIVALRGLDEHGRPAGISAENLQDIREQSSTLAAVAPFFAQSVNLTGVPEPDRLRGAFVTSDFFNVVATPPATGRVFGVSSDKAGSEGVAVLTYAAWQHRFGGRVDIIGRQLMLNNAAFTVIGVMPADFRFPVDQAEVFLPLWATSSELGRDRHNFFGVGRMLPGVTVEQASSEVASIAANLARAYPAANRGRGAIAEPLKNVLAESGVPSLKLLTVMVTIMLAAACANVSGVQLGGIAVRRREIAIRSALGAGRGRIARQLVIESVLRAAIGAAAGVLAASVAIQLLIANAPDGIYGVANARLSPVVLMMAVSAALLSGVATGLPAAWHWSRIESLSSMGAGVRSAGDPRGSRVRGALVVSQIALATLLLIATGLTTRSFSRLASVDPGFDAEQLLTMEYRLPKNRYAAPKAQTAFHNGVLARVRAIPGVVDAAGVRALPFSGNGSTTTFRVSRDGEPVEAPFNTVSDRYFETMRVPFIAGRTFDPSDRDNYVVIVSRTLAERQWPGHDPLGRSLYFDGVSITASVIGVVGDVRHRDLTDAGAGVVYTFLDQNPGVFNTLAVRTSVPPLSVADAVRRAIWAADPDQPVWKVRTAAFLVDHSLAERRFLLQLIAFFGISAAALAVLGLYGVVAAAVAQRTREIGVRIALGATRAGILSMVLKDGVRLSATGVAMGLAAAVPAGTLLRTFLFGVGVRDPVTYAGTAGVLIAAALVACWVPALRAVRVDPTVSLRHT